MIKAKYVGIDYWGRPVFRNEGGEYYCVTDMLPDEPFTEEVKEQLRKCAVIAKGSKFEGEPIQTVHNVELVFD